MEDVNPDWLNDLQSLVDRLLAPIIPVASKRDAYLDDRAMAIWRTALTHESYNRADNYEDLEYLGDAVLKGVFGKYLTKRVPHVHKDTYTNLNNEYMSKVQQALLAKKMGLVDLVLVKTDKPVFNVESDVFESFIGALETVSDLITPGLGFVNCYNMIVHLFSTIEIDPEHSGHPKTQVQQIFSRFLPGEKGRPKEIANGVTITIDAISPALRLRNPIVHVQAGDEKKAKDQANSQLRQILEDQGLITVQTSREQSRLSSFAVVLQQPQIDLLAKYLRPEAVDVLQQNPVIGAATANTNKAASVAAYTQALQTLASYGVTTKWAGLARRATELAEYPPDLVAQANQKAQQQGFVEIYFNVPRNTKTKDEAIVQLLGLRPNNTTQVLASQSGPPDTTDTRPTRLALLQHYLRS